MAAESQGCRAVAYHRRHPEQTALYQVVQKHLETYLALAREDDWDGQRVPAYVEREFRRYLECGILAYGFARARCSDCGHDFLVAFSRKGRRLCPSCSARRMAETAAHLVDHVIPPLPVRQWALSVLRQLHDHSLSAMWNIAANYRRRTDVSCWPVAARSCCPQSCVRKL